MVVPFSVVPQHKETPRGLMAEPQHQITYEEIEEYVHDEMLCDAIDIYYRCTIFAGSGGVAWPFAGGWADQPAWIVDLVETLRAEDSRYART